MNISRGSTRGNIILAGLFILAGLVYIFTNKNHSILGFLFIAGILFVAYYLRKAISYASEEERFLEDCKVALPLLKIKLRDLKDEVTFLNTKITGVPSEREDTVVSIISGKMEEVKLLEEQIKLYEEGKELIKDNYRRVK